MKKIEKNKELQTRREFFKSAAKGALPILGMVVLGPTLLASCQRDDEEENSKGSGGSTCGSSCKGKCKGTCTGHCMSTCKGLAISSPSYSMCKGTCKGECYSACRGTCMGSSKGGR